MERSRRRTFYPVILMFLTTAMVGCGNDESSASSDDTWFDASPVQDMYAAQIRMEAIEAGKREFDASCGAVLPMANKSLSDSGNGMVVQIMYKLCNNAGLKFQNKVRCESDRLQVLCR